LLLPVVGIGQAPAIAADCGGAVPCSCSDTVVADRTLVPGVDPVVSGSCPQSGLIVAAGTSLDLGSGTIRAERAPDAPCPDFGVALGEGATVTGGRIVGFENGITGGSSATISVMQVLDSCFFGIFLEGDDNTVTKNIVRRTDARAGIAVFGDRNVVTLNRVETSSFGIIVEGKDNVVRRNLAYRNRFGGIVISGEQATVELNQAKYTSGTGFEFLGSEHTVSRNIAFDNDATGIVSGCTGCTFDRNRSSANGGFGIEDSTAGSGTGGTASTYTRNVCSGNVLGDSSPPGLCR
jgi:hypothetical protein